MTKNDETPPVQGRISTPVFLPRALTADEIAQFHRNPYEMLRGLQPTKIVTPDKEDNHMSNIYGTGSVGYDEKIGAEQLQQLQQMYGGALEQLRLLASGSSIQLSGADFAATVQHLQTLAILELAEAVDVLKLPD